MREDVRAAAFAYGLTKAAAVGDNQPGPAPQEPAPPHTHRARNVALGAATLAGGILGVRPLNRAGTALARRNRIAAGNKVLSRMRSGQASAHEANRWLHGNRKPIGVGEKARALGDEARQRTSRLTESIRERIRAAGPSAAAKEQAARNVSHEQFWRSVGGPPLAEQAATPKKGRSLANRAKWLGLGGLAAGGAAVAGASGASKAQEPQSDDQPGLG